MLRKRLQLAIPILAAASVAALLLPSAVFVHLILWSLITYAVIGVFRGAVKRKPKPWFAKYIAAILLAVTGLVFIPTAPLVFRTKMPPMNYTDAPLPEVLQDFARQASRQGYRGATFSIHEQSVADAKVTLRTRRRLRYKAALNRMLETVNYEFSYGICGTCGQMIGPIQIARKGEWEPASERPVELIIYPDAIHEYNQARPPRNDADPHGRPWVTRGVDLLKNDEKT